MADGSVKPPVFSGKPDDDADGFVRAFDRYIKYREITDNGKKLNLFAVLLKDNAADWYDALSETSKDTFAHLSEAFAARYQSPDSLKYKCANDLFTKKQAETESVDEYVTRLRKLARLIGADDRILTFAVINGLYRLMHGCFHIGFHIRPDSSYLPDEGGQIWILIFARRRRANMSCLAEY
jgi:hypothetical protein